MKTKKIKARRMWGSAIECPNVFLYGIKNSGHAFVGEASVPKYVLPADAAIVEAMVEQGAKALAEYNTAPGKELVLVACDVAIARLVLAAIGIKGGAK